MSGGVFKRCGCRHPQTGRSLDSACPRLPERGHGSWSFDCAVASVRGRRERVRRGGYLTRRDALAARDALLNPSEDHNADARTVGRWLRYWLTTRTSIRPSTLRSYTEHVELHLIPHLGRVRRGELTGRHVADMFHTLATTNNRYGRPPTPATLHRIRATLRSARSTPRSATGCCATAPPGTSNCPRRADRRRRCGPTTAWPPGASTASGPRWRCGRSSSWSRSSGSSPTTGCSPCGG